jgi:apolipoprotein N-acyltransferase
MTDKNKKDKITEAELKAARPGNEARRIRWSTSILKILILFCSGMLMSASVPPLNWSVVAWFALIPLYWIICDQRMDKAWIGGYFWGLGWGFTGFFWLREINPAIPYMLAPIMALFPAFWAMAVPALRRGLVIPNDVQMQGFDAVDNFTTPAPLKEFLYALALAAWWCIMEWTRSNLLPWNYLSTSQWRNLPLLQLCSITGTYGISFLLALTNITLAMAVKNGLKTKKYQRPIPFMLTLIILMAAVMTGNHFSLKKQLDKSAKIAFDAALIQGNISQRRCANNAEAQEALDIYMKMSYEIAATKPKPDIIIWPETAVPYPYRGAHPLCRNYRFRIFSFIRKTGIPMLLGTIDFEDLPPGVKREPGTMNSAFLFENNGLFRAKYDKVHPVPFGEYVPFRSILPQWAVKAIDMNRDLTAGTSYQPLPLYPGVKAGISICFEDVFAYISRREALEGANILTVITNDAWYPKSSEPDQHLANAVFRAVETGLPMLRCGNNSASCLIQPNGFISDCVFKVKDPKTGKERPAPEIRGRKAGIIRVAVTAKPELTFYTKYGDVFLLLCWILALIATVITAWNWRLRKLELINSFESPEI